MTSEAAFKQNNHHAACSLTSPVTVNPANQSTFAKFSGRPIFHPIVFLTVFLLIFSRRPDAVMNAQFFAEDGQRWFADAYQMGLRCLLIPDQAGGYLHTVPRFAALLSLLFPFSRAPLVMNLCAILVQILPVTIFVSSRFSAIPLWKRLVLSFVYLGLPNTYGTNANVTNLQWHLGLLACLVLLAEPAQYLRWQIFDGMVLVLISVESPIGLLLVPFAAVLWRLCRDRWTMVLLALLLPGAVIQAGVVLMSHARQTAPNGANVHRLISILGRQVFLAPLVGKNTVLHFALRYSERSCFVLEVSATTVGLAILLYALRYAPAGVKLFVVFSFCILALSLTRPLAGTPDQPQWEWLRFPGTSNRYFFFPILAFLTALLWIADSARHRAMRFCSVGLLLCVCVGIRRDWRYPAFQDMHFREYASQFQTAPTGTKMVIPINPTPWTMKLRKK
jgi:hypothetical protein